MWPKRRPSKSAGEDERRWIIEASVGPDIAIFCKTRSPMTREIRETESYGYAVTKRHLRVTVVLHSLTTENLG